MNGGTFVVLYHQRPGNKKGSLREPFVLDAELVFGQTLVTHCWNLEVGTFEKERTTILPLAIAHEESEFLEVSLVRGIELDS
jgi:hypothetical protein